MKTKEQIPERSSQKGDDDDEEITPANDVVELHPVVLADVDRHHFAPEEEALHQHPGEGGHEEEMQQSRDQEAG